MGRALYVRVETTADKIRGRITDARKRQLPFATALALTRLARHAQVVERKRLKRAFKIRSKRVVTGIAFNSARKSDWPRPRSEVGTRDKFMVIHETGGVRRPTKGHRKIAIPSRYVQSRRTSTGKVPKRLLPRTLITGGKAKVLKASMGRSLIRFNARKRKVRDPRAVAYSLRAQARYRRRWGFREHVSRFVVVRYPRVFLADFYRALQTAR